MSHIIAVDIDCCVLPAGEYWWDWMNAMTKQYKPFPSTKVIEYDLSTYFAKEFKQLKIDPLDFWRRTGAYDQLEPYPDAVEAINKLSKEHEIVFVSHCKGASTKSKYLFLERYFEFHGCNWSQEKFYTRCNVLIDDRLSNLNKMPDDCTKIQIATPYTQNEQPVWDVIELSDWKEIYNFIERHMK